MMDLLAGEWLKLRTTRLLLGIVPGAVVISAAAVAGATLAADRDGVALDSSEGIRRVLSVTGSGALVVLIAGIIIAAGEYRHGTAADTFLTTPRRERIVMAKLAVGACTGVAIGAVMAVVSVAVAGLVYRSVGDTFPLGDGEVWLILAGTLAYTGLFAVLGVALGSLVRSQVAAVAGALGWLAVVEHALVNLLPDIGRWFPAAAGQAIVRTPLDELLSPAGGIAVLALYGLTIAVAGVRVAATRDA
jgi:ABC-2 type transport system permease protein